jgi:aminoglycoside phosphotransferase (APT) family kinase protein
VVKARRLNSVEEAERVERLSRFLDPRCFPKVLARRGAALLTEWAHGTPLGSTADKAALFRRAGSVQATMHCRALPAGLLRAARVSEAGRETRLDRGLHELVRFGALPAREARRAWAIALAHVPPRRAVGLVHGDFCAENMVRGVDGRLRIVDNEALSVGACDYDLARTWYRWPMTESQAAAYFDGYAGRRGPDAFVAAFPYWAVMALVDAVVFRVRARTRGARAPLARLAALLRDTRPPIAAAGRR